MARRLNGTNQYFNLPVVGSWRNSNYNWYIGGWCRFMAVTTGYIADFGRLDVGATGGQARCRLVYDAGNTRIMVSSSRSDGTIYRERAITGFVPDPSTWYYIAYIAYPDSEINARRDSVYGTLTAGSGTVASGKFEDICYNLRFGARSHNTVSGYANIEIADWIWCSDSIPTETQIAELAAGTKPAQVAGLAYHHHWAFDQAGATEPSLVSAATLTAVNSPTVVEGPFDEAPAPRAPLPIIIV